MLNFPIDIIKHLSSCQNHCVLEDLCYMKNNSFIRLTRLFQKDSEVMSLTSIPNLKVSFAAAFRSVLSMDYT